MGPGRKAGVLALLTLLAAATVAGPGHAQRGGQVRFVTDEADAALDILARLAAGEEPGEEVWRRLAETEGFRRLEEREHAMGRPFSLTDLRAYLASDSVVARREDLERTVRAWRNVDLSVASARAAAYLPPGAPLRAAIYLLIKPQPNSFVFGLPDRPGIYLYVDPAVTAGQLTNTIAHELHHIGYGTVCQGDTGDVTSRVRIARRWLGALGEGYAMLAAAGGADVHPHAESAAVERARWDADVARFDDDLRMLDAFFVDILEGRIDEADASVRARQWYGIQGPWYTVGWRVAATIERGLGRARLVSALCDPGAVLEAYQEAVRALGPDAGPEPALWSPALLEALKQGRS